jgi:single-strand DNA-binding protein
MNNINLIGRITKELELKTTPNEKKVCEFSVAVNRIGTDKTDFINCQIWGKQAENLTKYQGKGSLLGITGSLNVDTYEVEGKKKYKTYVLVNNVEFLGTKKETDKENLIVQQEETIEQPKEDPFAAFGQRIEIADDDLPF